MTILLVILVIIYIDLSIGESNRKKCEAKKAKENDYEVYFGW